MLVANRGEIVLRVARACLKMGIEPCGIYSDADANSLHVKYCKKVTKIGGQLPSESYLRMDKIIDAAKKMGCDLIHPGYGFLAENAEFSELCVREGLAFVGPPSSVLKVSGDKVRAREIASSVAPVLQGREVADQNDCMALAEEIGYPVILKAVKGGGGRGLRIVRSAGEIPGAFASSLNEAGLGFGSSRLYLEKYLEKPRHIEVQILGDDAKVIHLFERECSIQRRHQKLIEETPSPALNDSLRQSITQTAIKVAKLMHYKNAGTVEFLFENGMFYFMELNSRIQVEHPITEAITGVDIVEQQLRIACGEELQIRQEEILQKGHAIECRINAEHPISFVPFSGTITKFIPPDGKDVRVDSAAYTEYSIPPFYDSLIAKLICHGQNRTQAIDRMMESLMRFRVSGIPTTIPFHVSALNDTRFVKGDYDTSFVEGLKPFSTREGEIAAAVFSQLPKRTQFLKYEGRIDRWAQSRFEKHPFHGEWGVGAQEG